MVKIDEEQQIDDVLAQDLQNLEDLSGYGSPQPAQKDSTLKFFRELIRTNDSRKFANLTDKELGQVAMSVRDLLDIALYAEFEGLEDVSDYLKGRAENVLSTSLGLKGFLAQLFVTQIKKQQNIKPPDQKKHSWWQRKPVEGGQQNE